MRHAAQVPSVRRKIGTLLAPLAVAGAALAQGSAAMQGPHARASGVESVGLTVSDLERSVAFFREVLDFELVSEQEDAGA